MISSEPKAVRISESLGPEHYDRIAQKMVDLNIPDRWCTAAYECACAGCANTKLTWAEYECWKKYNPEFNRISQKALPTIDRDQEGRVKSIIPIQNECEADTADMTLREQIKSTESHVVSWVKASDIRFALEDPPEFKITTICAPIERIHDAQ